MTGSTRAESQAIPPLQTPCFPEFVPRIRPNEPGLERLPICPSSYARRAPASSSTELSFQADLRGSSRKPRRGETVRALGQAERAEK